MKRTASAAWTGGLKDGKGSISTQYSDSVLFSVILGTTGR
jgi:hypothetical protein